LEIRRVKARFLKFFVFFLDSRQKRVYPACKCVDVHAKKPCFFYNSRRKGPDCVYDTAKSVLCGGGFMEKRLKFGNKLAYGVGDFGSNYCWTFVSMFALIYFTDTVGVSAAAVATLIMVSKILDGFTDVLMGGLIDKTKSKMGKARPWLFWSAFPLMILLVLLFSVPAGFSATGKNAYIFIIYTLLGAVCYTASNISYNAMTSLVTDNPKDRVSMGSIRFLCAVAASLVLSSTTVALVNAFGGGRRGWVLVAVLYALVYGLFTMITVFGVREMKATAAETRKVEEPAETLSFAKSILLLCKNKYFIIMLGLFLVNYISSGLGGAIGIYYVQYVLGNPALLGLFSLAGMIPMMIVLPLAPRLTSKFGMQRTCLVGSLISVAGSLVVVFSNNNIPILMAGLIIRGVGGAPFIGTMYALVAEVAEYAALKFKVRMEGVVYSCCSVGIKVGSGVGVALAGWLLTAGHYDGAASVQPQSAVAMIQSLYLIAPLIIALLVAILLWTLKVEKANAALKAEAAIEAA
jgi:GPH family glycoside/pentoside/hexuronide:cation symporter